jgi:putative phosphoesterase
MEVADSLRALGPLAGVHGNNDTEEVRLQFPAQQRLSIDGHRLALLHGHSGGRTALAAARTVEGAEIVLFGHSHRPWNEKEGGALLFNPGSPTDRRWFPYASFGVIDLGPGTVEATIIPVTDGEKR